MRRWTLFGSMMLAAAVAACAQQSWEVGGSAGVGFLRGTSVTGGPGSATAGLKAGGVFGGHFGQNLYKHLSGEMRYQFLQSDLRISSGSSEASFNGVSHVVHYDLLLHTSRKESKVQAFAAMGGGLRVFRGTGRESAYQPLSEYAVFTRTQELKPMASLGGGIKIALGPNLYLRTEVRDYFTAFPKEVITPIPGTKVGRFLHDIVPMAGISFTFR